MRVREICLGLLCLVHSAAWVAAADLPRSTPEEQGVSSVDLRAFLEAADSQVTAMNSVMIVRHGHVIAEGWWAPYRPEARHSLYSLSKSFTSTAIGIAIAEGKVKLDDPVLKYFPEDAPAEPSNNLKAMRVSDLLRMATGQQSEPERKDDLPWTKTFLAHPVPFKPGTHFLYNTSATYMLSAIIQKATGQTLLDYLQPRLFEPLGIENPTWESSPQGISTGGYGLSIRTEDIAKFGQLYLQGGNWQGRQLVPKSWVEAATARQVANGSNPDSDWDQGYGYQFWRCRNGAFRGDGAFGQYCIVLPELDAVIAITSGVRDMQQVLNLVWDKLLPAFRPLRLKPDAEAQQKLQAQLRGLMLPPAKGAAVPRVMPTKKYTFPENDRKLSALKLEGANPAEPVVLSGTIDGTDFRLVCGKGQWVDGRGIWGTLKDQPCAVSGNWVDAETFVARICFYETPFIMTMQLKFAGDEVRYKSDYNVGFRPPDTSELVGKAVAPE
ncbi:MAG: serine hydrolase [Planctomycetes bacterium]|nr:serine hydrolase [Planctomycetota bacterium]